MTKSDLAELRKLQRNAEEYPHILHRDQFAAGLVANASYLLSCAERCERLNKLPEHLEQLRTMADSGMSIIASSVVLDLIDAVGEHRQRLQIDPGGSDKIDELEDACMHFREENKRLRVCGQREVELKAEVARLSQRLADLRFRKSEQE